MNGTNMLIDTNVILEVLFSQEHREDCTSLLDAIYDNRINEPVYLTRFSLSAIQAACKKERQSFLRDLMLMIFQEKIQIPTMDIRDDIMINSVRKELDLDFDDAMQFIAAQKKGTYLVTYDKDFTDKPVAVKTPAQVLKQYFA